jgi:hypothetical protein
LGFAVLRRLCKLNFNFNRDIAPVSGIMRAPNVMSPRFVPEFIAYAKANPGRVIYLYRRAKSVTASTLAETAWAAVDFLLVPTGIAFVGVMVTISTMLSWDGRL